MMQDRDGKMKICYIGSAKSPHMQRWGKWFADKGHEVHLITSNSTEIERVTVHLIGTGIEGSPFNFLKKTLQTRKLVRGIKPDILHAHYIFGYGLFGAFANYHPFVVTAWGSDILIDAKESIFKRQITKYVLKKTDLITCDAEHMKKAMIELGTDHQKIYRIYWGTDTRTFNPEQRSEQIRADLGIFNSPTIISSKNFEKQYDIKSLVKSVPLVLKKVPKAEFVIAGRGSQEAELEQLAKFLGVSDSVNFIGYIPSDVFPKYLASADIYVCTSLSDGGLAIATKEAMACELPVIITDLDVNIEWIENGKNGFVVPLKDPKTIAEKIIYLIERKEVRAKFGKMGRKMVKERFEYNKEMNKVEKLYEHLISVHKK